jgi:hypothetical protein
MNYGITGRLAAQMILPYLEKRSMDTLFRQPNQVNTVKTKDDGARDFGPTRAFNSALNNVHYSTMQF